MISSHADAIRAIATRGELGAVAELMAKLPKLEIVSCYGVGTDAIDLAYARANGIRVTNTPDVLTEDVADIGIGLLLAVARQIPQADAYVRSGQLAQGQHAAGHARLRQEGRHRRHGPRSARRSPGALPPSTAKSPISARREHDDLPYDFVAIWSTLAAWADFLIVTLAGGEGDHEASSMPRCWRRSGRTAS